MIERSGCMFEARSKFGMSLVVACLVAACSSPIPRPPSVPAEPPRAPVVPPISLPAPAPPPPAAVAVPVPPAVPALPAAEPALPYSAAVAARFPEPAVTYRTPAFEAGHTAFTSNEELAAALRGLLADGPTTVKLLPLGTSQRGVPIEALLFTRSPAPIAADVTPESVLQDDRPTVLLIGQQHGDEPAGAEALLAIAQSLARGPLQPLLDRINVVILPRANPDGAAAGR